MDHTSLLGAIPAWILAVPAGVLLLGALVVPVREPLPQGARVAMLLQSLVCVALGAMWSRQGATLLAGAMSLLALDALVVVVRGRA